MYSIRSHKLIGPQVEYHDTKKKSGKIKPKFLVLHYTAGASFEADVRTLSSSPAPASCHITIAEDGRIAQIARLNDKLWHAGRSSWRGYNGLNSHSIGIEVTCPGPVTKVGNKAYRTWWGEVRKYEDEEIEFGRHTNGGPEQYWVRFTPKQIEVIKEIGPVIMNHYGIQEAVGHDMISPKRKSDPGLCMPSNIYSFLNGRREEDIPVSIEIDRTVTVFGVPEGQNLNFRNAPSGDVIGSLPNGTSVRELGSSGNWAKVQTPAGHVGWVWGSYLK